MFHSIYEVENEEDGKIATQSEAPESTPPSKLLATMPNNDQPLTIDIVRMLLTEQTQSIQVGIRNEIKTMGDDIKAELQAKITQLNDKIDKNQSNVQIQMNALKSDVEKCMERTMNDNDDFQRMAKSNELKISGIAYINNENLNEIFKAIAELVNFDVTVTGNVPKLTRIVKRCPATNESTPTTIIIVKFIANHIRNDFYRLY